MFVSRALRFSLTKRRTGGGITWATMDPALKKIATKEFNPHRIEGTPLKYVAERLSKAGLHNPWLMNYHAKIPHIILNQKMYYKGWFRHVPFAITFTIVGDIVGELYYQAMGKYNNHYCPLLYPFPNQWSTNRMIG